MVEQLNDETRVGGKTWAELLPMAMQEDYQSSPWYLDLTDQDKSKVETLRLRERER